MADIKTHLRELSVATTIGLLKNGYPFAVSDLFDSNNFYHLAQSVIYNNISVASNILTVTTYTGEYRNIIENGYKLGKKIFESCAFSIGSNDTIYWLGNDTQKGDPIDIYVGAYGFSLKEESFILRNMGLYELLNCLTGAAYKRGLHVFSTFAPVEYDAWFAYSWSQLITYLHENHFWLLRRGADISTCRLSGKSVIMNYNGDEAIIPGDISTNVDFMRHTTSRIREKVFSKWINEVLSTDGLYTQLKRNCSVTAGKNICELIVNEYSPDSLYRFFQIYDKEYYYAKTTHAETTILRVPNKANFSNVIRLEGCTYDVPASQLNIISTFVNTATGKRIQFRNECRFSHGQFNGTPEAKMYVVRNTPLTELYIPVEDK